MKYLYGTFTSSQMEDFKKKLHKKLFWLLLYKDPDTQEKYSHVNFDNYFKVSQSNKIKKLLKCEDELIDGKSINLPLDHINVSVKNFTDLFYFSHAFLRTLRSIHLRSSSLICVIAPA